jgi:tetratricopeptide (TPR) repeat protein
VRLRIEDWDDAIKDFQQALRLARDNPRPQPEAYLGLARAYARRGRLRDAAEWLRKAPISIKELRELSEDPDFAELRASRYSKDAFGF